MRKVIKIGFPIVCIAVVGGTFFMLHKLDKKVEGTLKSQYNNTSVNSSYNEEVNNENSVNEVQNDIDNETNTISYSVPVN